MNKTNRTLGFTFAPVPMDLILSSNLKATSVRVYAYLSFRQGTKQRAWPGVTTIAVELGVNKNTIQRALRELVADDWVRRQRRLGKSSLTFVFGAQHACRMWDITHIKNDANDDITSDAREIDTEEIDTTESDAKSASLSRADARATGQMQLFNNANAPVRRKKNGTKRIPDMTIPLYDTFAKESGIDVPMPKAKKDWASFQKLWKSPINDIRALVQFNDERAQRLIKDAIKKMRADKLTIVSPKSIVGVCIDLHAQAKPKKIVIR